MYLVVSKYAVRSILLREVDREQRPIYFVSKTFMDCQKRYLTLEKLIIALVLTSQKLMYYFQAHPIAVYTKFSLKNILSKADLCGRLSKWDIELSQSDIKFLPMATIKGQVLANFVAEFSPRVVSPEQDNLASAHRKEESLGSKLVETQQNETRLAHKRNEPIKKSPTALGAVNTKEITKVPKVIVEPPRVDPNTACKMFINGVKNSLGAGVGVVLKAQKEQFSSIASG